MKGPEKPKPKKRKRKTTQELDAEEIWRCMEARLTSLWIQDLQRNEKLHKKAHQLALKRRSDYIR